MRRRIKLKKILTVIVVLSMIVSLVGCSKKDEVFYYESSDKEWSLEIPSSYEKYEEEKQEGFYFITYKNNNDAKFSITEVVDKETVINEEIFEKELGEDSYFHIQRVQTIDVEGLEKVYGAVIEDEASNGYMIYFKTRINDKVVSFVASKNKPFSVDEEAKIISIISNIKMN